MSFVAVGFVTATVGLCGVYLHRMLASEKRHLETQQAALEAGLTEPASLHPVIDKHQCIGCGSCVTACPEGAILGLIDGKAELIEPTRCIGHGACRTACPADAITLVFGTERRGVDIPHVKPNFETNVPALFIAGELGGMGLIRNAIEQGRQAVEAIRKLDGIGRSDDLDLVIVGAGPAGFSASLCAMQHGLKFATLEQDTLGGTVAHYPRGKLVMTAPVVLPQIGRMHFRETTKEELLAFWREVEQKTDLRINYGERVDALERHGDGFIVRTLKHEYRTRAVLLTIGRRGTPRKLRVPGEDQTKVSYRLIDPQRYAGQRVLVVGGGDSALEAACSIAEEPNTDVTLSYRSGSFGRAKPKNRQRVEQLQGEGRLRVLMATEVKRIGERDVELIGEQGLQRLLNDAVIVCAGGILPTPFLKKIGVDVETRFGTA